MTMPSVPSAFEGLYILTEYDSNEEVRKKNIQFSIVNRHISYKDDCNSCGHEIIEFQHNQKEFSLKTKSTGCTAKGCYGRIDGNLPEFSYMAAFLHGTKNYFDKEQVRYVQVKTEKHSYLYKLQPNFYNVLDRDWKSYEKEWIVNKFIGSLYLRDLDMKPELSLLSSGEFYYKTQCRELKILLGDVVFEESNKSFVVSAKKITKERNSFEELCKRQTKGNVQTIKVSDEEEPLIEALKNLPLHFQMTKNPAYEKALMRLRVGDWHLEATPKEKDSSN